ncbi:hypothetical protein BHM03_00044605 [Ensete ventricosum]|nr:hypothetical protein BHM03_00044605 [Ensete ventricosum]
MASSRSPLVGAVSASVVALKSSLDRDDATVGKQRETTATGSLPGGRVEQQQRCYKRLSLGGGVTTTVGGWKRSDHPLIYRSSSDLHSAATGDDSGSGRRRLCIEDLLHWRCRRADCKGDRSRGRRKCGWKRRKKVLLSIFRSKKKLTMSWDVLSFDSEEMRALLYLCKKSWPVRAAARAGEGCDSDRWRAELESSDPRTTTAMFYFIVKQRSWFEKTIDGCGFVERDCCKKKKEGSLRSYGGRGRCFTGKVEMARLDSVVAIVASRGLLLLLTIALWLRPMPEEVDSCVATVESHG